VLVLVIVLVAGVWFGEDSSNPARSLRWLALDAALGIGSVVWLTRMQRRLFRVVASVACIAAAAAGFLLGQRSESRAYNYCVEHCEELRTELRAYQEREGRYPERLTQAIGREQLCVRSLRGTLLWYSTTNSSYQLEFGDYLVTWRATDRDPFIATK